MEIEKRKKKRATKEDEEEDCERRMKQKLKSKGSKEKEEENCSETPTEEEVEEFYAILKRMKVVVKYFDDKGKGGREWRETLEKPAELAVVGDADDIVVVDRGRENIKKEKIGGEVVIIRQAFDLNDVAPEAAESGGA